MSEAASFGSNWRGWLEKQFLGNAALVRALIWNRLGRVRDRHQVDELAAETWARAVRAVRSPGFDATREFAPWVCGIAVNVCREHARNRLRQNGNGQQWQPLLEDPPDPHDYQQAQALLEVHRAVAECLMGLTDAERKLYGLRFEQGLSGRASAEALGVPESTFRETLLPGLLAKLACCLAAKGFTDFLGSVSEQDNRTAPKVLERKLP